MSAAINDAPRVVHAVPGRLRVHLPGWTAEDLRRLERRLCELPGVDGALANPLTQNVLVRYRSHVTDQQAIMATVLEAPPEAPPEAKPEGGVSSARPTHHPWHVSVVRDRRGHTVRARIAVPGLDLNPRLARLIVQRLQRHPGVRVQASPLTGRVLVEFEQHHTEVEDLVAEILRMDLPDVVEEPLTHPLDPGPLVQSATRTAGAALGLALVGARRVAGTQPSPPHGLLQVNALIGILSGFPLVRVGLRRLLGRTMGDLVLTLPGIVGLTLSDSPLGLVTSGVESVRLLTEVRARREAFRRLESRFSGTGLAQPGEMMRLETGERAPLTGTVMAGTGMATGPEGLPRLAAPGSTVLAGTRLFGGPFVLESEVGDAQSRERRSAPLAPSIYTRYSHGTALLSLGFAALRGLMTRSFTGALEGMLLVTPRTAVIGMEAASIGASARVLRGGVTVVGTRPERCVRRPDVLLLDGPRLVTDGFEVTTTLPLTDSCDAPELLERAAAVATAAGSPWGGAFRAAGAAHATDGTFDGRVARARVGGIEYTLGPVGDVARLAASVRLRHRGEHLLWLRRESDDQPLGILALRPRLAHGVNELVEACRRHGVALALLTAGDRVAAHSVARRAHIPLLEERDRMGVIRARQAAGLLVAFVSDSAQAAEAFALCDLAIGLADRRSQLPARADLLAPDLSRVAAIVEAGARRDHAVEGAVALSAIANAVGTVFGLRGALSVRSAAQVLHGTALGAMALAWLMLRGGEHPRSALEGLPEPRPEWWGGQDVPSVLRALSTSATGLTHAQAAARLQEVVPGVRQHPLVNDAPALRLADVGVAMGQSGTEVARHTADVVLVEDDFATLVETFVEGRSFWGNIRRALGLLIGGNLGEVGLIVGASAIGLPDPLNVRQILVVNMLTDILPALAIALKRPESRNLAGLAREGTSAMDRPLRNDIARRASGSALPSLAAFALALGTGDTAGASTVAFASIVTTQLAETLDAGWSQGQVDRPVVGAVVGSVGMLGAAVAVPPLRQFLGLALPTPLGWALVGAAALTAAGMSRAMAGPALAGPGLDLSRVPRIGALGRPRSPQLALLPSRTPPFRGT